MKGAEQGAAIWQRIRRAVRKGVGGFGGEQALVLQEVEIRIEGDLAQDHHDLHPRQGGEFPVQVARAVGDLLRRRLVGRRSAMHGGSDIGVVQTQAVIFVERCGLGGEAGVVQHAIQEVAGAVAGERASSAIGAMRAGSEAENQDAGPRVAPAGNGPCPVVPFAIGAAFFPPELLAIVHQSRAAGASGDLCIEPDEGGGGHRASLALSPIDSRNRHEERDRRNRAEWEPTKVHRGEAEARRNEGLAIGDLAIGLPMTAMVAVPAIFSNPP